MSAAFLAFLGCLAVFHSSEALLVALLNRRELSPRSLLISKPYVIAMTAACAEYFLELWLCPWVKLPAVSKAGLAAVAAGEALRKTAMITARHNFTHTIQITRRPEHELVTSGIYSWMRHPGYAGWLLWSVATQLVLCNPVCIVAFAVVSWRFFQQRIAAEDYYLAAFFGSQFSQYQQAVPSGIPWVT